MNCISIFISQLWLLNFNLNFVLKVIVSSSSLWFHASLLVNSQKFHPVIPNNIIKCAKSRHKQTNKIKRRNSSGFVHTFALTYGTITVTDKTWHQSISITSWLSFSTTEGASSFLATADAFFFAARSFLSFCPLRQTKKNMLS